MATFTKRTSKQTGKETWQAAIRLKGFPPLSATFDRKTDAREWANAKEAEMRSGRYFVGNASRGTTLADAIDRYMDEVLQHKGASTIPTQQRQLRWWKKQLGDTPLAELTTAAVSACRSKLVKEPVKSLARTAEKAGKARYRSNSTVISYLAALSHVCTIAVKEWEWLDRNPVSNIRRPTLNNARTRFLSDEERERLLAACAAYPDLHLAVLLSLTTGARRSEIWHLQWHQIDLNREMITLYKTKNKQIRGLPLIKKMLPLLKARKSERMPTPGDYLFPGLVAGKPMDLTSQWRRALIRQNSSISAITTCATQPPAIWRCPALPTPKLQKSSGIKRCRW